MKIIKTKNFPPNGYKAINLFGVVFTKKPLNKREITHESIHTEQLKELFYIGFYLLYCLEFIYRLISIGKWHEAYRNISFEKEAYSNQNESEYIINRPKYAWTNYL